MIGSAKHTAKHDGAAYRFASKLNKDMFEKNPEAYLPQFGGYCAFGVTVDKKFDGDPRVFAVVDNKLYLNLNPDIQGMWNKDVSGNIAKAAGKWSKVSSMQAHSAALKDQINLTSSLTGASAPLAVHGYDPVGFFTDGLAMLGSFKHTTTHAGAAYRFVSEENKSMFEKNPAAYLPQCGGFCAFGVAVGKKFDGDPRVFAIVDDKLYFNLNPDIQAMWNKDVAGNIAKASDQWRKIENKMATEL